jgi:formylglycine-generating enzyme required for sulfatase activity
MSVPTVDARSFCIDSTEVTQAQYSQFIMSKMGDTSGQESRCMWNTNFGPHCAPFDPVGMASYPVACVDWCDAVAFCSWAGKRLCGRIGTGPPLTTGNESTDQTQAERFSACTHGGSQRFPYGNTEIPGYCVFSDISPRGVAPVASDPHCVVTGYDSIYDMIGNVQEWVDACDETDAGASNGVCLIAGGDYLDNSWACDRRFPKRRADNAPWLGFRCCAN